MPYRRSTILFTSIVSTITGMLIAFLTGQFLPESLLGAIVTDAKEETVATPYLHSEEVVVVHPDNAASSSKDIVLPIEQVLFEYVEVTDGCGVHFEGDCLNVRSGPGQEYPVLYQLRNGIVLRVGGKVNRDGEIWYKIIFDEYLRYPERLKGDWYVHSDYVTILYDEGEKTAQNSTISTTTKKKIIVDRSDQILTAYEGDTKVMSTEISTGLALTPTPRGTFTVYKKTPSRYMQGPLPYLADKQVYDLPGVPWNLYFTEGGAVVHGAYWHDSFGSQYSHGCVNVPLEIARTLYDWADLGTTVIVRD